MKKLKLLVLSTLLYTVVSAQTNLCIQNTDSNMVTITMKECNIVYTLGSKGAYTQEIKALKANPEYLISSFRGKFRQTASGPELLPKGNYTMLITWNKPDQAYRVRIKATDN